MKKIKLICAAVIFTSVSATAQIKTPQPSPKAKIEQTVGLTEIGIEYSRPGVKDRVIFGELEKWDVVWRTGANASTKIKFDDAIKINGQELAAGEYALYTIPNETEWTIIFNKNLTLWGAGGYKEEEDALRIKVKPTKLNDKVESFTIDFSHFTYTGANLNIKWENTLISLAIETNAKEQVEKQIKSQLVDGPGAGSYAAAAAFYLEEGTNLEQALTWMNTAIEKRSNAFWYVHNKAKILAKMGKKKEAIEAAKKSMEMAKDNEGGDYGYVANNEKLIKELEGK